VIGLDNIVEVSGADFNEHTDFGATIAAKVGLPYMGEITTERSAAEGNKYVDKRNTGSNEETK